MILEQTWTILTYEYEQHSVLVSGCTDSFKLNPVTVSPQITQLDVGSTLLEAKLFPQETLFLEAKE